MRHGHLHFDCPSGLAGDMFLGACLDLGVPREIVEGAVAALALPGVTLDVRRARRGGMAGTRFRVLENGRPIDGPDPDEVEGGPATAAGTPEREDDRAEGPRSDDHRRSPDPRSAPAHEHHGSPGHGHDPGHHAHPEQAHRHGRHLAQIIGLLQGAKLVPAIERRAVALFRRLGEAEARVHGTEIEKVHFHEVGAVDALVDLVGAAAAFEWLAPARVTCGPVNLGSGHVHGAHGTMPVPPPAVAELVRGIPVYQSNGGELLTPTGAVLLAELVDEFRALPTVIVDGVGTGLGRKEVAGRANAFRLIAGRPFASAAAREVMVVECEVDDLPAEGFGFALERLLEEGALDVYFTPVQMKKSRPGTLVTVLARPIDFERLAGILLVETGSLGCRFHAAERFEAERASETVATPFGEVRIKRARFAGRELAASPEFEDCRRLAIAHAVPWREVHRAAMTAAGESR